MYLAIVSVTAQEVQTDLFSQSQATPKSEKLMSAIDSDYNPSEWGWRL